MNEYIFTWLIDRFSIRSLTEPKRVRSPVFKAENLNNTTWFLAITFESDDCFDCCLMRDHSEENIEIIRINYSIEVTVDDRMVDIKTRTKKEIFRKGDFNLWGSYKFDSLEAKLMLRCNMLECLAPGSQSIGITMATTIHSKLGVLSWTPSCISDTALFCGAEATEFGVSLKNVNDKVSLKINRIDNIKIFSIYLMCRICAYDKLKWECSRKIDNMQNPLNYDQSFEIPLGLKQKQITSSGSCSIKFYFNCSALVGTMRSLYQEKKCRVIGTDSMVSSNAFDVLRNDLEMMYTNKIQTDLELKVEREVFRVHKCVLSARSSVFQAMFEQNMKENQTGVVDITDVDAKILDMFLKYMYTGTCGQLEWESALNLMLVAEKYQVCSLKKECSNYLILTLSEDNVCDILKVAELVSDSNLKARAMDYAKLHHIAVLLSDSLKLLVKNNPSLASEVLLELLADVRAIANGEKISTSDSAQLTLLNDDSLSNYNTYLTSADITNIPALSDRFLA